MTGKTILVTGAGGFVGRRVVAAFSKDRVIACDLFPAGQMNLPESHIWEMLDIGKKKAVADLFNRYAPDIVIHCAGIAHQKIVAVSKTDYFAVNSLSTQTLAKCAVQANPEVHFVFLSSISVYGEKHGAMAVKETADCLPTSDYAQSKLDAEKRLQKLYSSGELKKLDILRLAPVYDRNFCINIEKRVYSPKKLFFLKFGPGTQRMSVLSRKNLVRFIRFRAGQKLEDRFCEVLNICDKTPCTFKEIIDIFKQSSLQPGHFTLRIPLFLVKAMVIIAGRIFKARSSWIASCYDKLAKDLVFDNGKMLETGYRPEDSLRSVFLK